MGLVVLISMCALLPSFGLAAGETDLAPTEIEVDLLGIGVFSASKLIWSFERAVTATENDHLHFRVLEIHKSMDAFSADLMLFCARGEPALTAKITVRQHGERPVEYLMVNLRDVTCAGYTSVSKASGAALPTEKVLLGFSEIEARYSPQVAVGGMKIECPELDLCLPMQAP